MQRGLDAAEGLGDGLVYAGFSLGVMPAQQLAQTRPGARGALLLHACLPVSEFTDRSLPDYDEEAAALLMRRVLDFLDR